MVRRRALLSLALALVLVSGQAAGAEPRGPLPPLAFEDQEGRTLSLGALRGRVGVIVYGNREAMDESIAWGRRLDATLRAPAGGIRPARGVEIVAVAQMGGIPAAFRGMLRALVAQRTPADFSLFLDWEDRLSDVFGRHGAVPTVVVADREGDVRLVVASRPQGAAWTTVVDLILRLR